LEKKKKKRGTRRECQADFTCSPSGSTLAGQSFAELCRNCLLNPSDGPPATPGAERRFAAAWTRSRLPATYPPVGAKVPPQFFIKEPATKSAPTWVGSLTSVSSPKQLSTKQTMFGLTSLIAAIISEMVATDRLGLHEYPQERWMRTS